jgi:hypothetical protein
LTLFQTFSNSVKQFPCHFQTALKQIETLFEPCFKPLETVGNRLKLCASGCNWLQLFEPASGRAEPCFWLKRPSAAQCGAPRGHMDMHTRPYRCNAGRRAAPAREPADRKLIERV